MTLVGWMILVYSQYRAVAVMAFTLYLLHSLSGMHGTGFYMMLYFLTHFL